MPRTQAPLHDQILINNEVLPSQPPGRSFTVPSRSDNSALIFATPGLPRRRPASRPISLVSTRVRHKQGVGWVILYTHYCDVIKPITVGDWRMDYKSGQGCGKLTFAGRKHHREDRDLISESRKR